MEIYEEIVQKAEAFDKILNTYVELRNKRMPIECLGVEVSEIIHNYVNNGNPE